jgi:hypothetical protein
LFVLQIGRSVDGRLQEVLLRTNRQRTGEYFIAKTMLNFTLVRDWQSFYLNRHHYQCLLSESVSFGCPTKIGLNDIWSMRGHSQ